MNKSPKDEVFRSFDAYLMRFFPKSTLDALYEALDKSSIVKRISNTFEPEFTSKPKNHS